MKKDFNDKSFADLYIEKHKKFLERLGLYYVERLRECGFCGGRLIDVGCGFGIVCLVLAREFSNCEVVGIDLSVPLLGYARDSVSNASIGDRVKFKRADVLEMPFENDSFDVIFNINMVHGVSDSFSMLNEIERIAKPEAYIFIKDLRKSWLGMFEKEINNALTLNQAEKIIRRSKLRKGRFSSSLLWWNFEA